MSDVNANIGVNIDSSQALDELKRLQRQISEFNLAIAKSNEAAALAQKSLQRNLINSINAIGSFSAELRTVNTTAESFTQALEGNKLSMREYFRYAGASTKTFGKNFKSELDTISKVAEERVKTLQTQYIKLGRDANGAMKAIAVRPLALDMESLATKTQLAAQKQAIFNQLMKQGSTQLLNFGKNTQWAGRQLMVGFTLPLMAFGAAASKSFQQLEAEVIKFRKVYGDLGTDSKQTEEALKNIQKLADGYTKYGVEVSKTVGLASQAAAAGFQGADLMAQTDAATKLAILGQIDQQQALETTISLQNAFKISSTDLASTIDFLNAVENQTVTSLDDITTAIPKVAPVIQSLGGDVKDLAFFLTAMKEGGVNAAEGANALKSGLASLINPSKKANDMLSSMGININNIVTKNQGNLKATVIEFANALDKLDPLARARAIETMFGKFQFARISTLLSNVTQQGNQASRVLDLAGQSASDLAGITSKELGVTSASALVKFQAALAKLKASLAPVGEVFMKSLAPIIEFVSKVLDKFNNLSDGTKKFIAITVGVIGGLGPILLMTFGLLANGVANIIKLFMTLRTGFQRLTGQSKNLGEQTQYMTNEQLDAAAAAHSLEQSHARLTQQFSVEAGEVHLLRVAYQEALAAGERFAMLNPGMMKMPKVPKFADGTDGVVVRGPGTGTSDSILARVSNGEAIIPAAAVAQNPDVVRALVSGNLPKFATGDEGIAFNGRTYNIPVGATSLPGIYARIAKYSNDVEGVSFVLQSLEDTARALGNDFKEITAKELKTIMKESGAERNNRPGTSSSGGLVRAHGVDRLEITDPTEIRNLYRTVENKETGPGAQVHQAVEKLNEADKARIDFAELEKERLSIVEKLQKSNNEAQTKSLEQQLLANKESQAAAKAIIDKAESIKLYVHSNYTYLLPEEANKGNMAPADLASLYRGSNIQTTMEPLYRQYAAELGVSLETALNTPSIAMQMHKDMGIFAEKIATEIGQVATSAVSDPQFYEALSEAERMLTGEVSATLTNAIAKAKQPGNIAAGWRGKTQTNRTPFTSKEVMLATALGGGTGNASYLSVDTKDRIVAGEIIQANAQRLAPYMAVLDRLDAEANIKLQKVESDLAKWEIVFQQEAQRLGITIGEATIGGIKTGARTASDSKATILTAKDIINGLIHELARQEAAVRESGIRVGQIAVDSINTGVVRESAKKPRRFASREQGPAQIGLLPNENSIMLPIVAGLTAEEQRRENRRQKLAKLKENAKLKYSSGGLMTGMGLMAGSMALSALPDFAGKATIQSTMNMASMGAMFGIGGAAAGAALGLVTSGISALIAKEKEQQAVAAATFKTSADEVSIFGGKILDASLKLQNVGYYIKGITSSFGGLNAETRRFVDMVNKLDKNDPLKLFVEGLKKENISGVANKIQSRVTSEITMGTIDPKDAQKYVLGYLAAAGKANEFSKVWKKISLSLVDSTEATKASFQGLYNQALPEMITGAIVGMEGARGRTFKYFDGSLAKYKELKQGLKNVADQMLNFAGVMSNGSLSLESFNTRLAGLKGTSLDSAMGIDALAIAIKNTKDADAIASFEAIRAALEGIGGEAATASNAIILMTISSMGAMGELQAWASKNKGNIPGVNPMDLSQTSTTNPKVFLAWWDKVGKAKYKAYAAEQKKIMDELYGNNTGGGGAAQSGLTAEAQKYLKVLNSEIDALEKKMKIQQKVNDETQRSIDLASKQQDLDQKIAEAKMSGNYIQAAILEQQKINNVVSYNQESILSNQQSELDALRTRLAEIEKGGKLTPQEKAKIGIRRASGGIVQHFEPGGEVSGPGTATSDSIPAMLSNGEYVIRASAVDQYGIPLLNDINAQRLATGGPVSPSPLSGYNYGDWANQKQDKGKNNLLGEIIANNIKAIRFVMAGVTGDYNLMSANDKKLMQNGSMKNIFGRIGTATATAGSNLLPWEQILAKIGVQLPGKLEQFAGPMLGSIDDVIKGLYLSTSKKNKKAYGGLIQGLHKGGPAGHRHGANGVIIPPSMTSFNPDNFKEKKAKTPSLWSTLTTGANWRSLFGGGTGAGGSGPIYEGMQKVLMNGLMGPNAFNRYNTPDLMPGAGEYIYGMFNILTGGLRGAAASAFGRTGVEAAGAQYGIPNLGSLLPQGSFKYIGAVLPKVIQNLGTSAIMGLARPFQSHAFIPGATNKAPYATSLVQAGQRAEDVIFQKENVVIDDYSYPLYTIGKDKQKISFQGKYEDVWKTGIAGAHAVPTNPVGLLTEAVRLNPKSKNLQSMLENFKTNNTSGPAEQEFLIQMSAAVGMDSKGLAPDGINFGQSFGNIENTDGFAELLSALAGNGKSKELIDFKVNAFKEAIAKNKQESIAHVAQAASSNLKDVIPLNPTQAPIFHSTKYPVVRNPDGSVHIYPAGHYNVGKTAADKTELGVGRSTVHLTGESGVAGHIDRWGGSTYTQVVTDYASLMKHNNLPYSGDPTDIYYALPPGKPLVFPPGSPIIRQFSDIREYKRQLLERGLLEKGQKPNFVTVDNKNNEILRLEKKYYTQDDRLSLIKQSDPNISSGGYGSAYKVNDKQLADLIGRESQVSQVVAEQESKKMLDIHTGHTGQTMWSLNDKDLMDRYLKLNEMLGIRSDHHNGSDINWMEASALQWEDRGIGKVTSGKSTTDSIEAAMYAALHGQFKTNIIEVAKKGTSAATGGFIDHGRLKTPKFHDWNGVVPGPYGQELNAVLKSGTEGVYQNSYIAGLKKEAASNTSTSNSNSVYNIDMTINGGGADANEIANKVMAKLKVVSDQNNRTNKVTF